jgi:hypothetical protein
VVEAVKVELIPHLLADVRTFQVSEKTLRRDNIASGFPVSKRLLHESFINLGGLLLVKEKDWTYYWAILVKNECVPEVIRHVGVSEKRGLLSAHDRVQLTLPSTTSISLTTPMPISKPSSAQTGTR